jgi:hypothetical protein
MNMTDAEKIQCLKNIASLAKADPFFRGWKFFDYVCATLEIEMPEYGHHIEVARAEEKSVKSMKERAEILKSIIKSMATFPNESVQEYILRSIDGEMGMAYSLGKFGKV